MTRPIKITLLAIALGAAFVGYHGYSDKTLSPTPSNKLQDTASASLPLTTEFLTDEEIQSSLLMLNEHPDPLDLLNIGNNALSENNYFAAYSAFSAAAQKYNTSAMIKLAELLEMGAIGGKPDIDRALKLYNVAFELGSLDATLILANFYELGINVPENVDKASHYYQIASNKGNSKAIHWLVEHAKSEPEFASQEQVLAWNLSLVDQGDALAMIDAANAYYIGQGTKIDKTTSIKLLEKAIQADNDSARVMLATILLDDHDIETDPVKATELLSISAANNNPRAQALLGNALSGFNDYKEFGIEPDNERAFQLIEKALDQNLPLAHGYAGDFYLASFGPGVDLKKAVEHFEEGAKLGDPKSMIGLALRLKSGTGIDKDYDRANQLIDQAISMNFPDAIFQKGFVYEKGAGVPVDYAKAMEYYHKAADLNISSAAYHLGFMYEQGLGLIVDTNKALEWYKKADELGDIRAKRKLDTYHKNGSFDVKNACDH
ncbi:SEL1-like repeat protein [Vibrio parahaemolyticus]|nr:MULTISPECIES: SEL1-like repeat protein [Vibrio]MCA2422234.1 SEL1-like repeat protein [Vibrio alginolyticus]MCA2446873.1 SEL1-like repeat protein [Vibrio alginolyticus]MCR9821622.1 SEL1-like repeat protein [Vibrio parahaemolyticus]MDF5109041.1 SEL1-like repeat protein [Vibrio parahaemolyticus]MDF5143946.1 SEL1-like repeat protein [Vibrio parahaemolyticus]